MLNKIVVCVFILNLFAALTWTTYWHVKYSYALPPEPDTSANRTIAVHVNHVLRYGTQEEYKRIEWAEHWVMLAAAVAVAALLLNANKLGFGIRGERTGLG